MKTYSTIDEYISNFPQEVQVLLEKMRQTIRKAAPDAVEAISYGIPTFKLKGNLVHFGGYAHHIGFYPGSQAIEVFKRELSAYVVNKGTVRFSLDQKIPFDLVTKIVKYRVQQSLEKK